MCRPTERTGSKANESNKIQIEIFKKRFCQDEVCVEFLGLFDCASPAGQVDRPPTLAHDVRHAVTMNRKNEPFQGMLFNQEADEQVDEHLEQLWFAGAHKGNGGAQSPSPKDFPALDNIPLAWMLNEVRVKRCPLCECVLRSDKQWGKRISDMVAGLNDDVMSLIQREAVQKPSSKDESGMDRARTDSLPDVVFSLWKILDMHQAPIGDSQLIWFAEAMISVLRFLILENSDNDYEQQAGCQLFHPTVFSLYRKGVLCVEDTPQSIVVASRVIDNEQDSASNNATFSIMSRIWCRGHANEAWHEKYGSQELEDLLADTLEISQRRRPANKMKVMVR